MSNLRLVVAGMRWWFALGKVEVLVETQVAEVDRVMVVEAYGGQGHYEVVVVVDEEATVPK